MKRGWYDAQSSGGEEADFELDDELMLQTLPPPILASQTPSITPAAAYTHPFSDTMRHGGNARVGRHDNLALYAQYVVAGVLRGATDYVTFGVVPSYYGVDKATVTSMVNVSQVVWNCRVVAGMLSDMCPLVGYRRKSYMFLGWFTYGVCLLVVAAMSPSIQDIHQGERLLLLLSVALAPFVLMSAALDARFVEMAQREPLETRGRLQAMTHATSLGGRLAGTLSVHVILRSLSHHVVLGCLAAPCFVMAGLSVATLHEPTKPIVNCPDYIADVWALVQTRVMWRVLLFKLVFQVLTTNAMWRTDASMQALSVWLAPRGSSMPFMPSIWYLMPLTAASVAAIVTIGLVGRAWNYRTILVSTLATYVVVHGTSTMLAIFVDACRSPLVYATLGQAATACMPILQLVSSFVFVELAPPGKEGLTFGLLATIETLPDSLFPCFQYLRNLLVQLDAEAILRDTAAVRAKAAASLAISYAMCVVAAALVVLMPRQKDHVQFLLAYGGKQPVAAAIVLAVSVALVVMALVASCVPSIYPLPPLPFGGPATNTSNATMPPPA
ncbi:Aste57867_2451 [Aphanomyces stellatus]|uniref:Aste57867_2451 protein n=1 Tax=Aphanomyces stellatus TaxID=120398 RepID=A0A485K8N5_9STRA|nr:hypothetical protein As57867_002445 [Aphanomyces stellatus]VFT79651.1 Aste57867_2451 [Aphanomyces stellatus]